jgi:hypothetical protein
MSWNIPKIAMLRISVNHLFDSCHVLVARDHSGSWDI